MAASKKCRHPALHWYSEKKNTSRPCDCFQCNTGQGEVIIQYRCIYMFCVLCFFYVTFCCYIILCYIVLHYVMLSYKRGKQQFRIHPQLLSKYSQYFFLTIHTCAKAPTKQCSQGQASCVMHCEQSDSFLRWHDWLSRWGESSGCCLAWLQQGFWHSLP